MATYRSETGVTAAQVRAQRDRILASQVFSRSQRQRAFLEYVVNAELEGRSGELKEFKLAIDVFEKDQSFDPAIDSIVRVEATRLRAKLRDYYSIEGQDDSLRIEIPKGHYVADFRLTKNTRAARIGWGKRYVWGGIAAVVLAGVLIFWSNKEPQQGPGSIADAEQLPVPFSVAVLPLRDWSRLPEEYFSESMTDALISSLAKVRSLRVTSLTSVLRYKDTEIPISEIGRALGVAYVVEGSLYRDADIVRVTTQLVAANTNQNVWSATIERPMLDPFLIQSEVANAVAAQISDELLPLPELSAGELNPEAYEAYMKGRYFYNQFTAEGFRRGIEFFQEAIRIEPGYARAYAGLASCHCLLAGHGLEMMSPVISIPQAHNHAMKALSLDRELAEPHAFLGIIDFKFGWDPDSAEARLEHAISLNPSLYHAYVWHSQVLEAMSRHDEAIERARYAKQLNPLSLAASLNLGWQLFQAGKFVEAHAEIDDLVDFNPYFWGGHWVKGHIYNQHQMYAKAAIEFRTAVDLEGGHSLPLSALGYTYAVAGMPDKARQIIARLESLSNDVYVSPYHVAVIYAGLNEADRMFEWLERAYDVRARSLAWMQVSSELKPFQDDARYQNLLKRIGIVAATESDIQARNDL